MYEAVQRLANLPPVSTSTRTNRLHSKSQLHDPPKHRSLRSLAQQVFTPHRVGSPRMTAITRELLGGSAKSDGLHA